MNQLPLSIGILAWNSGQTLVDTLTTYYNNGLLDLSDDIIEKHGPLGTPPSELVRLVLEQKDKEILMLKAGMKEITRK